MGELRRHRLSVVERRLRQCSWVTPERVKPDDVSHLYERARVHRADGCRLREHPYDRRGKTTSVE
jgi:hypothetical protein